MRVQESRENYLEAILMLQKKQGYVRSVDVANHLNFSRPSVSVAMANLRSLGAGGYRRARLFEAHGGRSGGGGARAWSATCSSPNGWWGWRRRGDRR